ncbi:MAG: UDP-N-acetylglucosamine 2-epimerase [Symbiobacteriia bacterium]
MKNIVYVTGTRADVGLLVHALRFLRTAPGFRVQLVVTGMHLSGHYGLTVRELEAEGFDIAARVDMLIDRDERIAQGKSLGLAIIGMAQAFEHIKPDVILVLGDRGEMLAATIAAAHMNIPVAHIGGGEISGSIDDSIRHAITKLAHIHFPTSLANAERIRQMGEDPNHIHIIAAPGLDAIRMHDYSGPTDLAATYGIELGQPLTLVMFHPDTTDLQSPGMQARVLAAALADIPGQVAVFEPNSDSGRGEIVEELSRYTERFVTLRHAPRHDYLGMMALARVLIGNSSSGIIEAPSFGLPVVNVGNRQYGRLRGANVQDVPFESRAISDAAARAFSDEHYRETVRSARNPYDGDRPSGHAIADVLSAADVQALIPKRWIDL